MSELVCDLCGKDMSDPGILMPGRLILCVACYYSDEGKRLANRAYSDMFSDRSRDDVPKGGKK